MNTIKSPYAIIEGKKITLCENNPTIALPALGYSEGIDEAILENVEIFFNDNNSITIIGDKLLFETADIFDKRKIHQ